MQAMTMATEDQAIASEKIDSDFNYAKIILNGMMKYTVELELVHTYDNTN